jgi:hypothetical protein
MFDTIAFIQDNAVEADLEERAALDFLAASFFVVFLRFV